MASLIADIVSRAAEKFGVNGEEMSAVVVDMMSDSGISIDEWREAYYEKRFPKKMTASTMAFQIKNLETEVKSLRIRAYEEGYNREKRTLSSFGIRQEDGKTVLEPKTRLAEIILQNTKGNLKLSGIPKQQYEQNLIDLETMRRENTDLIIMNSGLRAAIKDLEEKNTALATRNMTLEHDMEQTEIQMQEKIDHLEERLAELKPEQELKKEITQLEVRLHDAEKAMEQELDKVRREVRGQANREMMELRIELRTARRQLQERVDVFEDMEERIVELEDENRRLEQMVRGLAERANLEVESDYDNDFRETDESSDDDDDFDVVEHLMNEQPDQEGFSLEPNQYHELRVRFFDNDDGQADEIVERFNL
ncbi:non-structural protein 3 [Rotavirus G]|uniref:Non-structural protein 3 n=1 Tax=Rotavirus G TaxID=183407 RepID=A0A2R2XE75_9REOV|nr:non-structural protein 3 [Rotavirus G]ASV45201.1 non-structural protein 3 [Rotavirus G]